MVGLLRTLFCLKTSSLGCDRIGSLHQIAVFKFKLYPAHSLSLITNYGLRKLTINVFCAQYASEHSETKEKKDIHCSSR